MSQASANPPTSKPSLGPKIVVLKELEELYQPVPFEHAVHAEMAEMWDGCVTCHHHTPAPTTKPAGATFALTTQADSIEFPACKSCHPVTAEKVDLHKPTLKAAYHRQCLNCHRDWTGENACGACHAPKNGVKDKPATPDDITGRMHPPIKAKDDIVITARVEPVAGAKVLFRHKEHVERFEIKCVQCHRRDNCGDCHAKDAAREHKVQPMKVGRTWADSHQPCVECHRADACEHCHYKEGQDPPPAFKHDATGQRLDKHHRDLACRSCHAEWKTRDNLTCNDASCHETPMTFPKRRPGKFVAIEKPATQPMVDLPATQPSTRPVIIKIRRGGR